MQLGFGLPDHLVAKFDDRVVVGGQLDGLRQFAFEAREFYSIAVRHLHRVNIVQHIAHNRKKNIRVFCGGQQLFLEAINLILLAFVADRPEVVFITPLRHTDEAFPIALGSVFSATLLADQLLVFFQGFPHNRNQYITTSDNCNLFLNYFPRLIQVANDRIWRLRRAWRLSLRYRAFHLSAVLSRTFLIVSFLISIPRVCVFFQKKSTQMTKKFAFFRHSPPIICIPIF